MQECTETIDLKSPTHLKKYTVTVGVCTYKRDHLIQTIESLFALRWPGALEHIEILVVENDEDGQGWENLRKLCFPKGFSFRYVRETQRNIALARNNLLEHSTGDWLALIDDDEVATPQWIVEYDNALQKNPDAAVFTGFVRNEFPAQASQWIIDGEFFERAPKKDGQFLETGSTGNAFLNMSIIREQKFLFDPAYGRTGGEDSRFFFGIFNAGYSLIWVEAAEVIERLELNRMNSDYLKQRRYRVGQTYARFRYGERSTFDQLAFATKIAIKIVLLYGKKFFAEIGRALSNNIGATKESSSQMAKANNIRIARLTEDLKLIEAKGMFLGIFQRGWLEMY